MTVIPDSICRKYKGRSRPYIIARAEEYHAKRKAAAKRKVSKPKGK